MTRNLFVVVVPVGGEHQHNDFHVVNLIHQTVFLCDAASPLPCSVAGELFGMASAGARVLAEFSNQSLRFGECLGSLLANATKSRVASSLNSISYLMAKAS